MKFLILSYLFLLTSSLSLLAHDSFDDEESVRNSFISYSNFDSPFDTIKVSSSHPLSLTYEGILGLDDNGTGYSYGDWNHKKTTPLRKDGHSLNADTDSFVVAPKFLFKKGVRLGDRVSIVVRIFDTPTDSFIFKGPLHSIVGDIGSNEHSLGKISIKAATELGFTINERSNGEEPFVTYGDSSQDFSVYITYYPSKSN